MVTQETSPTPTPTHILSDTDEPTVKQLMLSDAFLTLAEGTTVFNACKKMAAHHVYAVVLTDADGQISGILTDRDIAIKVLAEKLRPRSTVLSNIMTTTKPVFVSSDTSAMDALQTLVKGNFRHLPVLENGEVVGLLDITKSLYDAVYRVERSDERGRALAKLLNHVGHQWEKKFNERSHFPERLTDAMLKIPLSAIISEESRVATAVPSDSVYLAAKRMQESGVTCVIIMAQDSMKGILTSEDLLFQILARNASPSSTLIEQVMKPVSRSATMDTTILEALRIMHDGTLSYLPVLDKDGHVVACLDALQITQEAISMAGADMIQELWDWALFLDPQDDHDSEMPKLAIKVDGGTSSLGVGRLGTTGILAAAAAIASVGACVVYFTQFKKRMLKNKILM